MLCVTIDGQILGRRVFVVDVTRGSIINAPLEVIIVRDAFEDQIR